MSYYHDHRDDFEDLYPTCTSFVSFVREDFRITCDEDVQVFQFIAIETDMGRDAFIQFCYCAEDFSSPTARVKWTVVDVRNSSNVDGFFGITPISRGLRVLGNGEVAIFVHGNLLRFLDSWNISSFEKLLDSVLATIKEVGGVYSLIEQIEAQKGRAK